VLTGGTVISEDGKRLEPNNWLNIISLICFEHNVPVLLGRKIKMIFVFDVIQKFCIVYKHGCQFCIFVNLFKTKQIKN